MNKQLQSDYQIAPKKQYPGIIIMVILLAIIGVVMIFGNASVAPWDKEKNTQSVFSPEDQKKIEQLNSEIGTLEMLKIDQERLLQTTNESLKTKNDEKKKIYDSYNGVQNAIPTVPQAEAASLPVERPVGTISDLTWFVFNREEKDNSNVYITQTQSQHFARNGMLAYDFGTHGTHRSLVAPDFNGYITRYTVRTDTSHDTTGKTIFLDFIYEGVQRTWLIGHVHEIIVQDGDVVITGDKIGMSGGCLDDSVDEGVSTGCHVHLEYWRDYVRTTYPETMGVQHTFEKTKLQAFLTTKNSPYADIDIFYHCDNAGLTENQCLILLAITGKESGWGKVYYPDYETGIKYFNPAGVKDCKHHPDCLDWSGPYPNKDNVYLQQYKSWDHFWMTYTVQMKAGYFNKCNDLACIGPAYVGTKNYQGWINTTNKLLSELTTSLT